MLRHIRADRCLIQLVRWRRADTSPIGRHFNSEWQSLWGALAPALSSVFDQTPREVWEQVCRLLPLIIEAQICGEVADHHCLERTLEEFGTPASHIAESEARLEADILPTNLL